MNACSTMTSTWSFTSRYLVNPTWSLETTSESSPTNWMGTITSWNSCWEAQELWVQYQRGQSGMQIACFRLHPKGKTQVNYDIRYQNILHEIQHPPKDPPQTQVIKTHQIMLDAHTYDLPTLTTCTPIPTTSVTSWSTARESSILSRSKPTPTVTKMPSRTRMASFPSIP